MARTIKNGASPSAHHFQLDDETSIERCAAQLKSDAAGGGFNLIVDATGALTINGQGPERALRALSAEHMMRNFSVNAIGPALLMKHLSPLLAPAGERSVYAKLSARVASIGDNKLGGWYSYRASKSALNQLMHTSAIELTRSRPRLVVAALQPGTVASELSKPFFPVSNPDHPLLAADDSVRAMLGVLDRLEAKKGLHFVDYEGASREW